MIGPFHPLGPDGKRWRISGRFGEKRAARPHPGMDFAVPTRTPVYACINSTVYREYFADDGELDANGNSVHLRGDGILVAHLHLDESVVDVGDEVIPGQLIGYSGNTGDSRGPHLHFQVNEDTAEKAVLDPVKVFPGLFE